MGEVLCEDGLEKIVTGMHKTTAKFGRGSVMVWGCISCDEIGITKVEGRMNGNDYIRLLSNHLLPYLLSLGSSFVFMIMHHAIDLRQKFDESSPMVGS